VSRVNGTVGVLTPQEAFDYVIYTHAVEGIEFTNEEKETFLKNLAAGTCGQAAEQAVQRLKKKYSVV
jgi:hypothetical protein